MKCFRGSLKCPWRSNILMVETIFSDPSSFATFSWVRETDQASNSAHNLMYFWTMSKEICNTILSRLWSNAAFSSNHCGQQSRMDWCATFCRSILFVGRSRYTQLPLHCSNFLHISDVQVYMTTWVLLHTQNVHYNFKPFYRPNWSWRTRTLFTMC